MDYSFLYDLMKTEYWPLAALIVCLLLAWYLTKLINNYAENKENIVLYLKISLTIIFLFQIIFTVSFWVIVPEPISKWHMVIGVFSIVVTSRFVIEFLPMHMWNLYKEIKSKIQ